MAFRLRNVTGTSRHDANADIGLSPSSLVCNFLHLNLTDGWLSSSKVSHIYLNITKPSTLQAI